MHVTFLSAFLRLPRRGTRAGSSVNEPRPHAIRTQRQRRLCQTTTNSASVRQILRGGDHVLLDRGRDRAAVRAARRARIDGDHMHDAATVSSLIDTRHSHPNQPKQQCRTLIQGP